MSRLALNGGNPVRTAPLQEWPVFDDSEERAILDVLRSGKWWFGEKVTEFEEKYAAFQGAKYGISCTNGTAALIIALKACGITYGDEVITTPMSFIATSTSIVMCGAIPVYVDVEEDTMNLDLDKVEAAITPKTKAILPVHVFGRPLDMDRLTAIADKHGLVVIEDAAHCWGGQWKGKGLGCIGAAGTFSFQYTKNMQSAEGGIVTTNDEDIADLAWSFMNCGRVKGGAWYYMENISPNQRLTEFQAAILLAQLDRQEEQMAQRSRTYDYLYDAFQNVQGVKTMAPEKPEYTRRSHHAMCLRFDWDAWDGIDKETFVKAMNAEGIPMTAGYGFPLYREPAFTNRDNLPPFDYPDYGAMNLPKAEKTAKEALLLPQYVLLAEPEEVKDSVRAVEKVWENRDELRG